MPVNVDPLDSKVSDPMERDRLASVFRRGSNRWWDGCCRSRTAVMPTIR